MYTLVFNISLEIRATELGQGKETKKYSNLKGKKKKKTLSVFAGDLILYMENPKDCTNKNQNK